MRRIWVPELVDAICQQVPDRSARCSLQTWRDMTGQGYEETPRLTASMSQQIVSGSLKFLKELDSRPFITSPCRDWLRSPRSVVGPAAEYYPEGFRAGWAQPRFSSMPWPWGPARDSSSSPVRRSFGAPRPTILATSGVEVHPGEPAPDVEWPPVLDVNAVGLRRLYGHAPQLPGLRASAAAPEIVAPAQESIEEADADASVVSPDSETPFAPHAEGRAPPAREVFTYPIDRAFGALASRLRGGRMYRKPSRRPRA